MEWFSGNIPEAIQLAKTRGSIFIVYITGEDEATKKMDQMWEEADVYQLCKQEAAVAIKIKGNSESCTFFSQIYPVVLIPSAYFIGNNGVPLEVLGGNLETDSFKDKVRSVLEKNKSSEAASSQPPQQEPQQQPAAASAASASAPEKASTSSGAAVAAATEETDAEKQQSKADVNDRVERAKELIERKRLQKAQEEAEKERLKEIERRKTGQSVQQLKQFQHERELQEVREQLKKEKEEERKARERVKQDIERDRAERNARFQKEKTQKKAEQEEARKAKLMEQQKSAVETEARRSQTARIQFRLPDGSSVSNQFPSSDQLQAAYDFITQRVGGSVTLSTAYPRRTFSQADMATSFIDLQLAPTAVLIVVPASGSLGHSSGGGGGGLLSVLFAPLMVIWKFIMSFLFPSPAITRDSNASAASAASSSATFAAGGDRAKPSAAKRSRQEGNVRRMINPDDDDDEDSATWNGNSTQQL